MFWKLPSNARARRLCVAGLAAAGLALTGGNVGPSVWRNLQSDRVHAQVDVPPDGTSDDCVQFGIGLPIVDFGFDADFIAPDEGWVWIEKTGRRRREVSGLVLKTGVARNDTPSNHESHDWNAHVLVDTGYETVVSPANENNTDPALEPDPDNPRPHDMIELEWESGIRPSEKSGDGANPFFPKWAWPSVGDRIWAEGQWVYDCGHPKDVSSGEQFRSEIHPPRAVATMRDQAMTLPGTGATPVAVTATDLYIHGRGGFVVSQLTCGMGIIVDGVPDGCDDLVTPIADTDFVFDVCLPPRPDHDFAYLATSVADGPGNTVSESTAKLEYWPVAASDDCRRGDRFDDTEMLRVKAPLRGKSLPGTEVYARKIVSGWVFPPAETYRHLQLQLTQMDLHNDTDDIPFDKGELTFFWMSVDKSPDEWIRLADTADGNMNDYDDSGGLGSGEMNFNNTFFDFYVRTGQPFTVAAHGYDQDCFDKHFGEHDYRTSMYIGCWTLDIDEFGNNDSLVSLPIERDLIDSAGNRGRRSEAIFEMGENYGVGSQDLHAWKLVVLGNPPQLVLRSEYELEFTIAEIATADEDKTDLQVAKQCTPKGEVFLADEPFTCTITVKNPGPGLPRNVKVQDVLSGQVAATTSVTAASFTFSAPYNGAPIDCTLASGGFSCDLGTVPVGATATIVATVLADEPGALKNAADGSTDSTDTNTANNHAETNISVYRPIQVDIMPGRLPNSINLTKEGVLGVAVLTTADFDATTILLAGLCFGDAEDPAGRDCTESHGQLHFEDVDRNRVLDLLLHFDVTETGIDPTDTKACLIGMGSDGIGVYGCDSVRTTSTSP